MATIRTSGLPANFKPARQTQAVADEIQVHFGFTSFGTYAGHEPTAELGLDIFVSKADGDRLAPWLVENIERLGVDYVIWWQRIYNPEIATHWRDMADRGGVTQNHKDHVHVSLETKAPPKPPTDDGDTVTEETAKAILKVLEKQGDDIAAVRKFLGETNEFWAIRSKELNQNTVDAIKSKD